MDKAIADATKRISEILDKSRSTDQGVKLEVNGRILDACRSLMASVMVLVKAARYLQEEIGGFSKEFFTKNHRWTEGLFKLFFCFGPIRMYLATFRDNPCSDNIIQRTQSSGLQSCSIFRTQVSSLPQRLSESPQISWWKLLTGVSSKERKWKNLLSPLKKYQRRQHNSWSPARLVLSSVRLISSFVRFRVPVLWMRNEGDFRI